MSLREEITSSHTQGNAFSPVLGSRVLSYADDDTTAERNIYDLPAYSEPTSSPAPRVFILMFINIFCIYKYDILDSGRWISYNIFDTR